MKDRTGARVAVCTLLAVFATHYGYWQVTRRPLHSDFGQTWFAARALLHGQNPYALIGPRKAFEWAAPWFYPLPAALVAIPFAPLSEHVAAALFVGVGMGVFAWALTEHGYGPLWAFTSVCAYQCVEIAQWSPMLAGAYAIAPLSVILVAKPTVGAAVFVAKPNRWAFVGGAFLLLVAFLLQPGWVADWRHALSAASVGEGSRFPYSAPIMAPGGVLALLALTRWRRPEARLLVALACIPHTTLPYEALLLFLIPRDWKQALSLAVLSWANVFYVHHVFDPQHLTDYVLAYGRTMPLFLYLPCTLMVLRRPNEGAVPAWIETRIARYRWNGNVIRSRPSRTAS